MELLLGMLWLAGVAWAASQAVKHVTAEYRKYRASGGVGGGTGRHRVAWWTREAGKGFPVTRAGFHRGWLAHQTAMEQHHAKREEARTSHLEAKASIREELHKHRERQAEAQRRIDQATTPPEDDELTRLREARAALAANAEAEKAAGVTEETPEFQRLNADVVAAEQAVPWRHRGTTPKAVPPSQEGRQHMATQTETNYTTVHTTAKNQAEQAEYAAADITRLRQQAEQIAEDMEAANVDAATLSDQMDHVAQLKAAEEALTAVTDSGGQVVSGLQQRHGGIKEAVDDSPADPAEMGFYQE
jgi:hypothetical protein